MRASLVPGQGPLPQLDPIAIREEQLRHDSSCRPAYVLAETVAREYPAFLRGEVIGEDVLFVPRDTFHSVRNIGSDEGSELGTYVVEKGKPLIVLDK